MEKFVLEIPGPKREKEAFDFLWEFIKCKSKAHGTCGLDNFYEIKDYNGWLKHIKDIKENKIKNFVSEDVYFLVRKTDDKVVGICAIRNKINNKLKKSGGNICFSIRPSERKKRYGRILLFACLNELKKSGKRTCIITCNKKIAYLSKPVVALGGIKINTNEYNEDIYSININNSIKNNLEYLEYFDK